MTRLMVKKWDDFQHYRDRSPPWIKLHKTLLDDYEYQALPLASRALAPMLWLLASESRDGTFDATPEKIAFRLRTTPAEVIAAIKPMIQAGFLINASAMLAPCYRDAIAETEREAEAEGETEADISPSGDMSGKEPDAHSPQDEKAESRAAETRRLTDEAREILAFLNAKARKAFRPVPANIEVIVARLKEGASAQDCKQVIAKKCREWGTDEKMAEYLRPATLFGRQKFAQYTGELIHVEKLP